MSRKTPIVAVKSVKKLGSSSSATRMTTLPSVAPRVAVISTAPPSSLNVGFGPVSVALPLCTLQTSSAPSAGRPLTVTTARSGSGKAVPGAPDCPSPEPVAGFWMSYCFANALKVIDSPGSSACVAVMVNGPGMLPATAVTLARPRPSVGVSVALRTAAAAGDTLQSTERPSVSAVPLRNTRTSNGTAIGSPTRTSWLSLAGLAASSSSRSRAAMM
jgi:hypothetical protein